MRFRTFLVLVGLLLIVFSYTSAQVPQMINYQGKLTKSSGAVLDTTVQMVFSIYAFEDGTGLKWTETQGAVKVEKGIFNVLLGSTNPIPDTVFNGSIRYLGVKVASDLEITPRKPMVSVPYAYRAGSGQINCHDCDSIFVNVAGPDSVYSTSGTAFLGKASGSSTSTMYGIKGYADNTSNGDAYGGYFSTSSSGTGNHTGVEGRAAGSTFSTYGLSGSAFGTSTTYAYGVIGYGQNTSTGPAYGGRFDVPSFGTGAHYGVMTFSDGSSSNPSYGFWSQATNDGSGPTYGAYLAAPGGGTGTHYGINSWASSSSTSTVVGCSSYGVNVSTGTAYGGYFETTDDGTGTHYGISALGRSSSSATAYGTYSYARNSSTGNAYAGYFWTTSDGTGNKYGVYASAPTTEGYAGYFQGDVRITDSLVVLGGKNAAVKVDNGEYRLLYSQESSEYWFEDFGGGRLQNGKTTIKIDPLFAQTVNTQIEYRVYLTPEGDCKGLYVTNKTPNSFDVRELQGGGSNISFSYRLVAKRKGYENLRLAKMGGPTPEEVSAEQVKHQGELEKERAKMDRERIQMEKEQVRMEKEKQ